MSLDRIVGTRLGRALLAAAVVASALLLAPLPANSSTAKGITSDRTIRTKVRTPGDLARSTWARPTLFTVDQADRRPLVHAVSASGAVRATLRLSGARVNNTWSLAAGYGHRMWVGDLQDPTLSRGSLELYRFDEPRRLHGTRKVATLRFSVSFPDGPHAGATLLVDPRVGRPYIVTRDSGSGTVYRTPWPMAPGRSYVLEQVAEAPADVRGGSFSASGARVVLNTSAELYSYTSLAADPDAVTTMPAGVPLDNAEISRTGTKVLFNGSPEPHRVRSVATPVPERVVVPPPPGDPITGWTPVLDDQFNTLNGATWRVRDRQAYARDAAMVMAGNVTTSNGALRVQAKQQAVGGRNYTSGDLDTYGLYSLPNYFRIEVRAKVPFEQGMWAAPIWIRPADGSAGEIDLIETYGSEAARPMIHQTIHTAYGATHQQKHIFKPFGLVGGDALGWHVYTVEKTPGKIVMWVDGVQTSEFSTANASWYNTYYEAGKRWSLRSSLQVGGGQGLPDATTDWAPDKTAMLLDYVKTWVPTPPAA